MLDLNNEGHTTAKEDDAKQNLKAIDAVVDEPDNTTTSLEEGDADKMDTAEESNNGGTASGDHLSGQENGDDSSSADVEMVDAEEKPINAQEGTNGGQKRVQKAAGPSDAAASTSQPPPPVLKGTLSYNVELRRHLIRGMWNYENSSAFPHQRFELLRNLDQTEDPKELPKDGEFHGSFSLAYFHTTSKGKQKERSKVITETGVNITFRKLEDDEGSFKVDGRGTNQFGIFHINGTAKPSPHGDDQYTIILRKRYEPSSAPAPAVPTESDGMKKSKKRKMGGVAGNSGGNGENSPLPPPSQSYDKNVVCLQGKLYKEESQDLGLGEIVHRIHGMWSSGLDLVLADPQNVKGLCNRFEYEHKSSVRSNTFPVSGKYTGWFDLNQEDGSKSKIVEKDVTLKFRKNSAGYHNVDGRGSNYFGKYTITGTLTNDNVITIFRHFKPIKLKGPNRPVTSAPPPLNTPGQSRKPSVPATPEPQLKLDEVVVPQGDDPVDALTPPENPSYSAVSRGVLRLNDDGSHSCQGKWAVTREHFTNGQTSSFTFRLEAHHASDAGSDRPFPLDSAMYKGSFQLKKGVSRYQTIVDQQIVMKFKKNKAGSFNVYGKGVNAIGVFKLTGTLITTGRSGGQIEVYRIYQPQTQPPAKMTSKPLEVPSGPISSGKSTVSSLPTAPQRAGVARRESSRLVKVPSRLEDDDPKAQLNRINDKCGHILHFIREKDVERGAFFSEPVDPVALGIPTYYQVISEPMDLRTLQRKVDAGEVSSPEEFGRLARLVFENAMTFNIDPTHSVHQAARNLLILFNQKFRDVERQLTTLRRNQKGDKKGGEKKRRRGAEENKSPKRRRLDEAQEMATANSNALSAIVAAAPSGANVNVTRNEFNIMLQMIRDLQKQVVQTYTVLANSMSDEPEIVANTYEIPSAPVVDFEMPPAPKKTTKKKQEPKIEKPPEEDLRPLTLAEQELLTETINDLPTDNLNGVIQIIREAAKLSGDEDEIDLEIDQLDTATQRKLLRHVSKFIKKPKGSKARAPKKKITGQAKRQTPNKKAAKAETPTLAKPKADPNSLFAFGAKDDSESESEGEISAPASTQAPEAPAPSKIVAEESFNLGDGFGAGEDDSDEEDGNDEMTNGAATSWNIAKPENESTKEGIDDDDDWGAAKKEAVASKAREEDKKKREEKMIAEAEQAKKERLAEAVERGEEIKRRREEEEEAEARQRVEEEKEAEEKRNKAREAVRAELGSVEQTVDLDAQRDIMKQYEQNFEKELAGSASPSSDFGF
ncbi:unnamed protein product [Cylindrotheca closterium]|uniref:Uncharacterized protein n=1 Tax=Cylindrotheca closterium TaxID=2856 RepID=A0AAD2CLF1_9STRA|nr:unnamed protein product [Cylindrotheca closterium]